MDLRIESAARNTEAQSDIAGLVHRHATHPAIARICRVVASSRRCGPAIATLFPSTTLVRSAAHSLAEDVYQEPVPNSQLKLKSGAARLLHTPIILRTRSVRKRPGRLRRDRTG